MKICFIGPANNYHIIKWCNWFIGKGNEVHVISFNDAKISGANVHYIDAGTSVYSSDCSKIKYLFQGNKIKRIISNIQPNIVNVHYASSYGTATALSGINNYTLSVWGSDVYDFPKKSIIHKKIVEYSLNHATHIFSTSKAMAEETKRYTSKDIDITPFGVDTNLFNPNKRSRTDNDFVIGNIKALKQKYGIDYLLEAVKIIHDQRADIPLKVRIAGIGPEEEKLKKMSIELDIENLVTWLGFISQEEAAFEWANMDVGVVSSIMDSESFGVSAVEAQACGIPVVISDLLGLQEATEPGMSSIVVKRKDACQLANAIISLYDDPEKRTRMGEYGRAFVLKTYSLEICFGKIERLLFNYYVE